MESIDRSMKKMLFPALFTLLISCTETPTILEGQTAIADTSTIADNAELQQLYSEDQDDRHRDIGWQDIMFRDSIRMARLYEMLDSGLVITANDHHHAAMIFQHGSDTSHSAMAVDLMRKAIELDSTMNKWLLAAAIDRDLMRRKLPQIYGTQYTKMHRDSPWVIYDIDTTQISDEERQEYGVETLAEQRIRVELMNRKQFTELLEQGKTVEDIVAIATAENHPLKSEYDFSQGGLNSFGYQLMAQDRTEEALQIFELNTTLYPNGYNTHDSYGECLLELGRKEEAVAAYQKSLELNPENSNARQVIESLGKEN